jgi:hypothetical protein
MVGQVADATKSDLLGASYNGFRRTQEDFGTAPPAGCFLEPLRFSQITPEGPALRRGKG